MDIKKIIGKVRNISFIAAIFVIAIVGVYFILQVDSLLTSNMWQAHALLKDTNADQGLVVSKSKALGLMIAILLAFGSAVAVGLSEIRKDKPILVYCLKGLSLALAIGFVIFVHNFEANYLLERAIEVIATSKIVSLIFGYIGIGVIAINIASNAYLGIEE